MSERKDSEDYLAQLRAQGYEVVMSRGRSHWHIRWEGRLVATQSGTPGGGRGLANLKSRVRRFERSLAARPEKDSGKTPIDVDTSQPAS